MVALANRVMAQQPERARRVGVLMAFSEDDPLAKAGTRSFSDALAHSGWMDGKNIRIDYRYAAGDPALFRRYAAELVALSPDVMLAATPPAVSAIRQLAPTVPIVFVFMVDPVGLGLVKSLARPSGPTTGFASFDAALVGKWLELLREISPGIKRVGIIFNPETTIAPAFNTAVEAAAVAFGMAAKPLPVHDEMEIEAAIANDAKEPGGSLITLPDSFNITHRNAIIAAANKGTLPLMGLGEYFPRSGALMSYFFDPVDAVAQTSSYVDRILRGAKPGDLPVQQPTNFRLIINLKTAKALGLTVSPSLLQRADEVIE
jgi:putative ABC transport system substrate-binding protein